MRDHNPIAIENFNGFFQRGSADSTPIDHFSNCNNIQYSESRFQSRDGITPYSPYKSIRRIHNYITTDGESILVLDNLGRISHDSPFTVILTISDMTDFSVVSINGYAYITPHNGVTGLDDEFVYVYKGDGQPARKIGGDGPDFTTVDPFFAILSTEAGVITEGQRIFTVVYGNSSDEWSLLSDYFYAPVTVNDDSAILLKNIPVSTEGQVTQRMILVTDPLTDVFNGNPAGYSFKKLMVIDNVLTEKVISYAESDLTPAPTLGTGANPPTAPTIGSSFYAVNSVNDGDATIGLHYIAVSYETDTGFTTEPTIFSAVNLTGNKAINLLNMPISPDSFVRARRVMMTHAIVNSDSLQSDPANYEYFFVPDGRLDNNSSTTFEVEAFDAVLVSDASYLFELLAEVPAKVNITTYHDRIVLVNSDQAIISNAADYESFNTVDGVLKVPNEIINLTTCQEFRDVLHLFDSIRTVAYSDNNDVPSSWVPVSIDSGLGSFVHGITVVRSGSNRANIEYLLIANQSGYYQFGGKFNLPELSFKIKDYWSANISNASSVNHTFNKAVYIVRPDGGILFGDYANGFDAENIRWSPWSFAQKVQSLVLFNNQDLLIGVGNNGA